MVHADENVPIHLSSSPFLQPVDLSLQSFNLGWNSWCVTHMGLKGA